VIVWPPARPVTDKSPLRLERNEVGGDGDQALLKVKWRRIRAVGHLRRDCRRRDNRQHTNTQTSCVQSLGDSLQSVLKSQSRLSALQFL
jgi:hypothetical protein